MSRIIIDNRERKLIPYFPDAEVKALDIADILFLWEDTKVLALERKTVSDLAASISDKRYREQKQRLLDSDILIKGYLIEGPIKDVRKTKKSTLLSAMINTMVRDKMFVFHTKNIEESVEYIKKIQEKIKEHHTTILDGREEISYSSLLKTKKKDNMTKEVCFNRMLSQIPGLSDKLATTICEKYGNMNELLKDIKENETKNLVKLDKIGKKKAQVIIDYLL